MTDTQFIANWLLFLFLAFGWAFYFDERKKRKWHEEAEAIAKARAIHWWVKHAKATGIWEVDSYITNIVKIVDKHMGGK